MFTVAPEQNVSDPVSQLPHQHSYCLVKLSGVERFWGHVHGTGHKTVVAVSCAFSCVSLEMVM